MDLEALERATTPQRPATKLVNNHGSASSSEHRLLFGNSEDEERDVLTLHYMHREQRKQSAMRRNEERLGTKKKRV